MRHHNQPKKPRSVLLVNKKVKMDTYKEVEVNSGDVAAMQIQTSRGGIFINNVYNDLAHS
jgi:hypothetical protein